MLAQLRRIAALAKALAIQLQGKCRDLDRLVADAGRYEAAEGVEVWIVEQVPGLGDGRERQADLLEFCSQFLRVVLLQQFRKPRQQPAPLLDAHAVRLQ